MFKYPSPTGKQDVGSYRGLSVSLQSLFTECSIGYICIAIVVIRIAEFLLTHVKSLAAGMYIADHMVQDDRLKRSSNISR